MSYLNLKFRVDFLGHVKNVIINILFFTVYDCINLIIVKIKEREQYVSNKLYYI